MPDDVLIGFVVEAWQEKRLHELHNCPNCKHWLKLYGAWEDNTTSKAIPRIRKKEQCANCHEIITVALAGNWIKLWKKFWGFN